MTDQQVPTKKILKRSAQTTVNCSKEAAFDYISSSTKLHEWLKKSGAIPGAKNVEILEGPYDFVGARRKVIFESGDSAIEQLISFHPPGNYAYRITDFSNFLSKMSKAAYGQLWFDNENGETRITWEYSFTYRNIFAHIFLSLFLTMTYKKFMRKSLANAKAEIEKMEG